MFSDASAQASEKLGEILPEAVLAIVIVVVGWLVASIVYFITVKILAFFAIDKLVGKTPLDRMLKSIGIQKSISAIIALLMFWTAVLVTLIFAAEVLELEQVSRALITVTLYIPQVIAALLIIIFGMLLAKFLQTLATQAVSRAGVGYAKSVGKAVNILVLVLVLLAASEQLGFDLAFITTNVMILLLGIALMLGIAFVIGMRTVLENMLACHQLRNHLSVGQKVRIADVEGTVKDFASAGVIIENAQGETVVPATFFFKHTYTIS